MRDGEIRQGLACIGRTLVLLREMGHKSKVFDGNVANRFLGSIEGVGETSSWAITVTQETHGGRW